MTTNDHRDDIILVAIDGSQASQAAVRWAANTAHRRGIPLHLVTGYSIPSVLYDRSITVPPEFYDALRAQATERIKDAGTIAHDVAPELQIVSTVHEGHPIDMLLKMSHDVTMIVMGSRGLGGLPGVVLGSVSAAVVSHAACPVVVVRDDNSVDEDTKYGPVVVGVDGSEISQRATEYAFVEAEARGCELIAVHTWLDMMVPASLTGLSAPQRSWEDVERKQSELLTEHLQPLAEQYPNVPVRKVITRDRPVSALINQSEGAQLLIVGSHGRGGFKGMLLGSTSRALLQLAPCPLMVVRPESSR